MRRTPRSPVSAGRLPSPQPAVRAAASRATSTSTAAKRGARASVVGLAAALTLGGCQWSSPIQTQQTYNPADGVSASLGTVSFNNLLVVASQQGGRGNLVGQAVNDSTRPVDVQFSAAAEGAQSTPEPDGAAGAGVVVPARGTTLLTEAAGRAATLDQVPQPPGAMMTLDIRSPSGRTAVRVPIVAPILEYATLAPSAPAPAPGSPTTSPTAGPTSSPTTPGPATPSPPTTPASPAAPAPTS